MSINWGEVQGAQLNLGRFIAMIGSLRLYRYIRRMLIQGFTAERAVE